MEMGLESLRRFTNENNTFMAHSGIVITFVSMERAEAELEITENTLNLSGNLHGGAIYTLADSVSGILCRADGRKYVTESSDIRFLSGVSSGVVHAVAVPIRRGRRSCVIRADLTGANGSLLATVISGFVCVGEDYSQ